MEGIPGDLNEGSISQLDSLDDTRERDEVERMK